MIIDVHTHLPYYKIFPEAFMNNIAFGLVGNNTKMQEFIKKMIRAKLSDVNGHELVGQMSEAKVSKAVLLIADFGYAMGEAELSVEEMYELHHQVNESCKDQFIVFGGIDPRRGRPGVDLFEKSVTRLGFKGLKLYPPCGFELDDPGLYPLYEICDQYNLPVLSHTGPSFSTLITERRFPETALKVAEDFPKVNFILGHGGAKAWRSNTNVARKRKNVFLEISTFQTTVTQPEELEERFRYFFDHIPDQILFGSDWPMFIMGSSINKIVSLVSDLKSINDCEREKLFFKNAKPLLKLEN